MSSMALGAPFWKSSCLRQGHRLSKMSQPIPSRKKMRRMKMKCVHKFHFHMLLSCSELWEITTKKRDRKHACARKGKIQNENSHLAFSCGCWWTKKDFWKNGFLYHQCYLIRATEGNHRGCSSEEDSHAVVIFTGERNIVYFQGKYWRQPVHQDALFYQGYYLEKTENLFWLFPSSSPLCWALEGGKAIFTTLLLLSTLCVNTSDNAVRVSINCS